MKEFKAGLIFELPQEQDWEYMGAQTPIKKVMFPDGKQFKYLSSGSHQYTVYFDPWCCVSCSTTSALETYLNRMMELDSSVRPILDKLGMLDENGKVQLSFRALAVMSGTKPRVGNSLRAVAECARTKGVVGEKFWPSKDNMTEEEWYQSVPKEIIDKAKEFLDWFDIYHENIKWDFNTGVPNHEDLKDSFKYGGVVGCVGSPYIYKDGMVVGSVESKGAIHNYNHAIQPIEHDSPTDDVRDSYEPFDKKFDCNYGLGTPKLFYIKKKINMNTMKKYKVAGKSAVFLLDPTSNKLVPFSDGNTYKLFNGTTEYLDIVEVPTVKDLPFPLADYMLTEVVWDNSTFKD